MIQHLPFFQTRSYHRRRRVSALIVLTLTRPYSSFTFKWGRAHHKCAFL